MGKGDGHTALSIWQPAKWIGRDRKLLLKSREIKKLRLAVIRKGLTIVPLDVYLKGHLIKMTIAVGKGKKVFEKKAVRKEKDIQRDTDRFLNSRRS